MKLKQLLRGIPGIEVRGSKEIEITGISADSRTVAPGNLFIAKKGYDYDGAQFIGKAMEAGAAAAVVDFYDPFLEATQAIHPAPGKIEALLAAKYYGRPSNELFVVGVTGTKGKTTTSYLVHHLLEKLGMKCGLSGTVETIVCENRTAARLTTHDAIFNQKLLREMILKGCAAAMLEVSSIGIEQGRVDEIAFDVGIFTNLYSDHLDYHRTLEEYAAEKRKFIGGLKGTAILNGDSPWSDTMKGGKKRVTFGIETKADVQAREIQLSPQGTQFWIDGVKFMSPLMGRFNIYNLLGAIAVGLERGANLKTMSEIFADFSRVPGRLEPVPNNRGFLVFVDYAHSKEPMESVLTTLREIAKGRIILVFGAGGNRDPARRKGMGEAADRFADLSIVTSDNPRKEEPMRICQDIVEGFRDPASPIVEPDRKKAIEMALRMAKEGDIVLIAGKGHEKVQIFAHQTVSFDDAAIAKEALQGSASSDILP